MIVAVSFCNQLFGEGVLALVDPASGVQRLLDPGTDGPISGVGLAVAGDTLYCACSDREQGSYLAVFDRAGERRDLIRLKDVADVHSICMIGGDLVAVSTGTDKILRIALRDGAPTETLWACSAENADTHHLNAVVLSGESILVSGFGPRGEDGWSSAKDGFVYDVGAADYVVRGLLQPHSLTMRDGKVMFCESPRGIVRTAERYVHHVGGYSRGLAFGPDGATYVGSSVGRGAAGALGLVLNPAHGGRDRGRCALTTFANGSTKALDLSAVANEIYDIAPFGL